MPNNAFIQIYYDSNVQTVYGFSVSTYRTTNYELIEHCLMKVSTYIHIYTSHNHNNNIYSQKHIIRNRAIRC